jgi:lysine 6-dehydrogenase
MKILVLGGGAQGRVIAADLAAALPQAAIDVTDIVRPTLPALPNLRWHEADCSRPEVVAALLAGYDLGIGALPARFGLGAMQAAIAARRPLVDVSFCAEDPLALDADAKRAGVAIVPDAGLAPGLSNLVVGRAVAARGVPEEITVYVGGVAQDPTVPYGYLVTWSLDDLLAEYTRPARIVRSGRPVTVPVFSDMERIQVEGVGELEAFNSDGLRTLIDTVPGVRDMAEKTLRWPGHAAAVQPLVREGRFLEEFRAGCAAAEPRDVVAFVVRCRWPDGRRQEAILVDRYDPATCLTAMSRTTALTTAVVSQFVASGGLARTGVLPLDFVGQDEKAFRFVLDGLAARGVRMRFAER